MRKPLDPERLYLDFDSFFASAEQHLQPRLRGRPVGIVPIESAHTSLIAASREAKALGVRGIVSVREARRLVPDIVLIEARPEEYVKLHHRIVAVVDRIAPVRAVRSIDELVADVDGWSRPEMLRRAHRIKAALARDIGPALTCSIGLAANELLAKIAAERRKPDGLLMLAPEHAPGALLDMPLRDVPGIAGGMARRLAAAGITDMQALWSLAPKQARALWGGVEGERFWQLLHGYAVERPATRKSMYGHSRVLARDWRNSERAYACARLLIIKAARRMRREGYGAAAFSLGLHGGRDQPSWRWETRLPRHAGDDHSFLACLKALWPRRWPSSAAIVSVTLHDLTPLADAPGDLFDTPADAQARARWMTVSTTLDAINKRYGRALVSMGPPVDLPGGYAGAKIAFGRIPHPEDF